ncbi:MAG TPA: Tol-Pal system beta propeller repeat protein TolB [Thermohalobaculum sp.]|nr:Tol-Pal system beta propeller repeat protein TolB [Thermohalobaculum sp.]
MMLNKRAAAVMQHFGVVALLVVALLGAERALAQDTPLVIVVEGGQFEPLPVAVTPFEAGAPALSLVADDIVGVIEADLQSSGLFKLIPRAAFIARPTDFDTAPAYADWRAINADALITGRISQASDGRLIVQFRLYDTEADVQIEGLQFLSDPTDWRRVAHKVADGIYAKLTGEGPYFDSRIVFVDETGPKGDRRKRLAIMDQDGANLRYLPGADGLVLTPRFSPNDQSVLYISYDTGEPQVYLLNLDTGQRERLGSFPGMTFAPRFSPDGAQVVLSLSQDGNTDLFIMRLADRQLRRLTNNPGIDTSASFSPDGSQLVFESDRGGSQQLYIMPSNGGPAQRISFGQGNYGTPVWSPRGDIVAFTKILQGRFHIGVMRTDGTDERLLSSSFLDEGPTFSPNGRVVAFFRESPGQAGRAQLMSIDITGRNLRVVETPNAASDPAWSPIRR